MCFPTLSAQILVPLPIITLNEGKLYLNQDNFTYFMITFWSKRLDYTIIEFIFTFLQQLYSQNQPAGGALSAYYLILL